MNSAAWADAPGGRAKPDEIRADVCRDVVTPEVSDSDGGDDSRKELDNQAFIAARGIEIGLRANSRPWATG
jgi:hypothetical protein